MLLVRWPNTRQLKHHILSLPPPNPLMLPADNDVQCTRQPSRASQWPEEGCRNSLRIPAASNVQCTIHTVGEHVYNSIVYVGSIRMGCTSLFVERHLDRISYVLIVCIVFTLHLHTVYIYSMYHTNMLCVCVCASAHTPALFNPLCLLTAKYVQPFPASHQLECLLKYS